MYGQKNEEQLGIRRALIAVGVALVMFVIMIAVLGVVLAPKGKVQIANDEGGSGELLSNTDIARVKDELYNIVRVRNDANAENVEIALRWDTMKKEGTAEYPETTFIVDMDEYRQSYQVTVYPEQVVVSCPTLGESKYPESYCRGGANEFDDSVGVVFGKLLPYRWESDQGEGFIIERNGFDTEEPLFVQAFACDTDTAALERVNAAVDELIVELGATPKLFGRRLEGINCGHTE